MIKRDREMYRHDPERIRVGGGGGSGIAAFATIGTSSGEDQKTAGADRIEELVWRLIHDQPWGAASHRGPVVHFAGSSDGARMTEDLNFAQGAVFTGESPSRLKSPGSFTALQNICMIRALRGIVAIVEKSEPGTLEQIARVSHDIDALYALLLTPDAFLDGSDPLAKSLLRGAAAKRRLLQEEGGVVEAAELAEILGISPQAIGKQRDRKQILGLPVGRRHAYPLFQLAQHQVLRGIPEALAAFADDVSPWEVANFFLTGDRRLEGKRPIDVLREGDVDAVARAARGFGEHGV